MCLLDLKEIIHIHQTRILKCYKTGSSIILSSGYFPNLVSYTHPLCSWWRFYSVVSTAFYSCSVVVVVAVVTSLIEETFNEKGNIPSPNVSFGLGLPSLKRRDNISPISRMVVASNL
jgi:hypothetical protein